MKREGEKKGKGGGGLGRRGRACVWERGFGFHSDKICSYPLSCGSFPAILSPFKIKRTSGDWCERSDKRNNYWLKPLDNPSLLQISVSHHRKAFALRTFTFLSVRTDQWHVNRSVKHHTPLIRSILLLCSFVSHPLRMYLRHRYPPLSNLSTSSATATSTQVSLTLEPKFFSFFELPMNFL